MIIRKVLIRILGGLHSLLHGTSEEGLVPVEVSVSALRQRSRPGCGHVSRRVCEPALMRASHRVGAVVIG